MPDLLCQATHAATAPSCITIAPPWRYDNGPENAPRPLNSDRRRRRSGMVDGAARRRRGRCGSTKYRSVHWSASAATSSILAHWEAPIVGTFHSPQTIANRRGRIKCATPRVVGQSDPLPHPALATIARGLSRSAPQSTQGCLNRVPISQWRPQCRMRQRSTARMARR